MPYTSVFICGGFYNSTGLQLLWCTDRLHFLWKWGGFWEEETLKDGDISGSETRCQSWYKQTFQNRNRVKPNSTTSLKASGIPTRLHSAPHATGKFLSNLSFIFISTTVFKKNNGLHSDNVLWYCQDIYLALIRGCCKKKKKKCFNHLFLSLSQNQNVQLKTFLRSGFFCVQRLKTFHINILLVACRD